MTRSTPSFGSVGFPTPIARLGGPHRYVIFWCFPEKVNRPPILRHTFEGIPPEYSYFTEVPQVQEPPDLAARRAFDEISDETEKVFGKLSSFVQGGDYANIPFNEIHRRLNTCIGGLVDLRIKIERHHPDKEKSDAA